MQNLAKFSEKPGKLHFEGLVHIFRYIIYYMILGLNYYADINDSPLSELLRQAIIITENQFMAFSDSSWQDFLDTGRSKGAY